MNCESAQQNIVLAQYGELPDELQLQLEQHLTLCEECRREWNSMLALSEELAQHPLALMGQRAREQGPLVVERNVVGPPGGAEGRHHHAHDSNRHDDSGEK